MSSFFRMGRQPDAFQLRFGYQGYVSSDEEAAPRLKVRAKVPRNPAPAPAKAFSQSFDNKMSFPSAH